MSIEVRIEPAGVAAERATAAVCHGAGLERDPHAAPGAPAATGSFTEGAATLDALVQGAELALDEVDVRLTARRA